MVCLISKWILKFHRSDQACNMHYISDMLLSHTWACPSEKSFIKTVRRMIICIFRLCAIRCLFIQLGFIQKSKTRGWMGYKIRCSTLISKNCLCPGLSKWGYLSKFQNPVKCRICWANCIVEKVRNCLSSFCNNIASDIHTSWLHLWLSPLLLRSSPLTF